MLFLHGEIPSDRLAEEIVEIFFIAQREDLRLSESLSRAIRTLIAREDVDFFHSPIVSTCFVEILSGERNVGRVLKAMHRAGVLVEILPEFRGIDGTVNLGGHHQFTVDEHTLRTLEELDRIESGAESVPHEFRDVASRLGDRFPLRLALLLHDIGKGLPGDHSVSGSEVAIIVCERLGLSDDVAELVEFLVYRHLEMFRVSERHDYTEESVAESFARLVRSETRLDMLYLLTFIDITSVGPGTWTSWKGAQLSELRERTVACLRSSDARPADFGEVLAASRLSDEQCAAVREHCEMIDNPTYRWETVPERMWEHVRLVRALQETGLTQVALESFGDYHEVLLCSRDRPHLFADFVGVLFSEGLNLLGARVFSRSDGVAFDFFYVEVVDGVQIPFEKRVERIRSKLADIESRKVVVGDLIRGWTRSYRFRKLQPTGEALYTPIVALDNDVSERSTVIDVIARDRPGLLYDLAGAISRLGLNIGSAKVSTLTDRARDVFFVTEIDGHKVLNPARRREIELTLATEAHRPTSELL